MLGRESRVDGIRQQQMRPSERAKHTPHIEIEESGRKRTKIRENAMLYSNNSQFLNYAVTVDS